LDLIVFQKRGPKLRRRRVGMRRVDDGKLVFLKIKDLLVC